MPSRVNVLLWCTAPPSRPPQTRSIISAFINEGTDAFDNQPDDNGDLLYQRPQGIEKRHQKAINPRHSECTGQSARTLHVKIMRVTKRTANAGNMRGFVPRRPDHACDITLSFFAYLFACLLGLFALCGFWYGLGKPVILPDVASATHKLQCASYTPFDKDQSPFDQPFKLRPERMDADLALLATRFECIRTYSMTGLEALPDLARKHGLKLMIGAWVNSNPVDTEKEVDLLIASANANADVVTAVIVGNETLLRKEVTGAQLAKLINKVKSQVKQPVTYADVWEFWLKHPEIAPAVDFSPSICCPIGKTILRTSTPRCNTWPKCARCSATNSPPRT